MSRDRYTPVAESQTGSGWLSLYRARSDSLQVVRHDGTYDKRAHLHGDAEYDAEYYSFDFVTGSRDRVVHCRWMTSDNDPHPVPEPQPAESVPGDVRAFLAANGYTVVNASKVHRGDAYAYTEE